MLILGISMTFYENGANCGRGSLRTSYSKCIYEVLGAHFDEIHEIAKFH